MRLNSYWLSKRGEDQLRLAILSLRRTGLLCNEVEARGLILDYGWMLLAGQWE